MPIRMQCENPDCLKHFQARDTSAGKRVKCPGCGQIAQVPGGDAEDEPEESPQIATPRAGFREKPGWGRTFAFLFMLLFIAGVLAGLGVLAYTAYEVNARNDRIAKHPEVIEARDAMRHGKDPTAHERFSRALDKAGLEDPPDTETWRNYFEAGAAGASSAAVLALLCFVIILTKSRMSIVYEYGVFCCFLGPIIAALLMGVGFGLFYYALNRDHQNAELQRLHKQETDAFLQGNRAETERLRLLISEHENVRQSPMFLIGAGIFAVGALVGAIAMIGLPFCFPILFYKLWRQVQDGNARTSPGMALFGLFIPLFNLYWVFVAFVGLAKDLNRCADNASLKGERVSIGMMITFLVLGFCSLIPFIGIVAALVNLLVAISVYGACTRVATALANAAPADRKPPSNASGIVYLAAAALLFLAAGGVAFYFVYEPDGVSARRATEIASLRANNPNDVVCLIKITGPSPAIDVGGNAKEKEKIFLMVDGQRREFHQFRQSRYYGFFGVTEYKQIVFVVPRSATKATLHLGDQPPIEVSFSSWIWSKIEL